MNHPTRLVLGDSQQEDTVLDNVIRPRLLSEYTGQTKTCEQLRIFMEASRRRHDPLDHLLIFGPPGLGKTTLASIVANELQVTLKHTSGPVIERAGDLAALLTQLKAREVLFIDEIHRLSAVVEEVLYSAMEDYQMDIMIGEGPAARSIKIAIPPFTLIGATTRAGMLTSPLRDRFGIVVHLTYYHVEELQSILLRAAKVLGIRMTTEGAFEIAKRSRGTPRVANRLLRRVRDVAEVEGEGTVTLSMTQKALQLLEVDEEGLDVLDRKVLWCIIDKFQGGPVGIESVAQAIGESKHTLEDVVEPYLIQQGFLQRTPRGRVIAPRTYHHFGIKESQETIE